MKFKRITAAAALLLLALPLLLTPAQAHPGDTDSNGGHTNTETGDYHYHHGFEAHAHFDIDGDGTIDCPFDFVNKTGQNSGTRSSGTSTPGDGSEDGYQEGYVDGYWEGKSEGQESGYSDGYADGEFETEREFRSQIRQLEYNLSAWQTYSLWTCGVLVLTLVLVVWHSMKKRKKMEINFRHQSEAKASQYTTQTNINNAMHEAEIKQLKKQYQDRIDGLVADHQRRFSRLAEDHATEVRYLKRRLINFRRLEVLESFASGRDKSIEIPDDVHFRPHYVPVRGRTTKRYPFGSYTVFVVPDGKKYHSKHDCSPRARPLHFFDVPIGTAPCSKCVPSDMYPQPRPDWYIQLQDKLDAVASDQEPDVEEETIYYTEASNGLTVRVPDSALDNVGKPATNRLTPEVREHLKRQLKERIFGSEGESEESDIRFSIDVP